MPTPDKPTVPGGQPLSAVRDLAAGGASDGSLGGDVRDVARQGRAGAALGARVAGAYGAAIGAVSGAVLGAVRNPGARRRVAVVGLILLLVPALLGGFVVHVADQAGRNVTQDNATREQMAQAAAVGDGIPADDIDTYVAAAAGSGAPWTLLAAVDRAAGGWSDGGDPPYGIEDLDEFNKAAAAAGVDQLSEDTVRDRVQAGAAYGRLFAARVRAEAGDLDPADIAAGAVRVLDPQTMDRWIPAIDENDPISRELHERTRTVFQRVLENMPAADHDAGAVFQTAFRWAIGQREERQDPASACAPAQISVGSGPSSRLPKVANMSETQVSNAAKIIAVGKSLKLPERAWRIALMTALVESQLGADGSTTSPDGNHDVGVFQQRALVGWYANGRTYEQNVQLLNDVQVGAKAFYQGREVTAQNVADARKAGTEPAGPAGYHVPGLLQIDSWQTRPPGEVAQAIQVSAFPSRYAQRESEAVALINALSDVAGDATAASDECQSGSGDGDFANCPATGWPSERGLKPDALRTLRCTKKHFPMITTIGGYYFSTSGEHPLYRAVDVMIPDYQTPEGKRLGDEIADWLKANWRQLGIMYIIWQERIWSVQRADEGWRQCGGASASCYNGPDDSAAHRNHVHVSVYGNKGVLDTGSGDGTWGLPYDANFSLGHGACTGASDECWGYGGHTGQDLSVGEGTPIKAVAAGTVTTAKVICPNLTNGQRRSNASCSYGRFVVIDHGGGVETYYAHLNSFGPGIKAGTRVQRGQVIGTEGEQGNARGSHLHLEVRRDGAVMNPITYLEQQGVPIRCSPLMTNSWAGVPAGDC